MIGNPAFKLIPNLKSTDPFVYASSALAGAAMSTLALAEPFIASDAAVVFWLLFSYRKRTSPRGNERGKVIKDAVLVVSFYYNSKVFSTHHNIFNLKFPVECSK